MEIREATAEHAGFLLEMLVEACNWTGERRVARRDIEVDPHLRHYVSEWPRARDLGMVAIDDHGTPVGAAQARTFSPRNPGYGFVAADIPEISMAVVSAHRGRGIGRRLLRAIIDASRESGWRAISLSVEDGNHAADLYRAAGFKTVARNENAETMLLELDA